MAFKGKSEFSHLEYRLMAAMKDDVDQLWQDFHDTDSVRFRNFIEKYNAKEFSTIYLGRFQTSELVEFLEQLLIYTASYMFSQEADEHSRSFVIPGVKSRGSKPKKVRTFQERVFGLYLTYCLYFLQPSQYVVPIRITTTQAENLIPFLENDLLPEHKDAAFCLFRLIDHNAFTIMPFAEEYNPLFARHYEFDELNYANFDVDNEEQNNADLTALSNLKALSQDGNLNRISQLHAMYNEEKAKHGIPTQQQNVKTNLTELVTNLLQECETTLQEMSAEKESTKGPKQTRAGIRSKAYGSTIVQRRDRRHRQDLSELDGIISGLGDFGSPKKKHNRLDMDPLQEQIWREVNAENRKTERVRRETLTEEINEEILLEKEVEKDINRSRKKAKPEPKVKSIIRTRRMLKSESQEAGPSNAVLEENLALDEELDLKKKQPIRKPRAKAKSSSLQEAFDLNMSQESTGTTEFMQNFSSIVTQEEMNVENEADSILQSLLRM